MDSSAARRQGPKSAQGKHITKHEARGKTGVQQMPRAGECPDLGGLGMGGLRCSSSYSPHSGDFCLESHSSDHQNAATTQLT